jgi:hypothetical protein
MSSYEDRMSLHAEIRDLARRLAYLEHMLNIERHDQVGEIDLTGAYGESITILARKHISPKLADAWCWLALRTKTATLLSFVREVGEPFPWVPILRVMRLARRQLPGDLSAAAEMQLTTAIRDLLDVQGLGMLEIDDIIATPSVIDRAYAEFAGASSR